MEKGEIARYEQFLLFPQCFLKTCTADTAERVYMGKQPMLNRNIWRPAGE